MKLLKVLPVVILSLVIIVPFTFAAKSDTATLQAVVPSDVTLEITVSNPDTDPWTEIPSKVMDMGTLKLDTENNIYRPDTASGTPSYFVIDVSAIANGGTGYRIDVTTAAPKLDGTGAGLGKNFNVTFVATNGSTDTQLDKISLTNANGKQYSSPANIPSGKWLRTYVGMATGSGDGTGVEVATPANTAAGTYSGGSITYTMTAL